MWVLLLSELLNILFLREIYVVDFKWTLSKLEQEENSLVSESLNWGIEKMALAWESFGLQFGSVTTICVILWASQAALPSLLPPLLNQNSSIFS